MPAVIFNGGSFLKNLKPDLRMGNNIEIITNDTDDPTVVAKNMPIGSIYIRKGTNEHYIKQDSGSSTNFKRVDNGTEGPASSTDNALARFDGTTGELLQNSTVTLSDAGALAGSSIDADTNTITNIENADIKTGAAIDAAKLADGSVSNTEFQFINSLSSNAQTQLDAKLNLAGGTMTGNLILNADATNPLQATTKQQLDAVLDGIQRKTSVVIATTANITLSGEQTIDGILTSASRVLVKDQSTASENGIYVSAAGAWSRSTDANSSAELNHAIVSIQSGTENGNTAWEQNTDNPNIGVDNIVWAQAYGAGTLTADEVTLTLTGSVFSINAGGVSNAQVNASAAIAHSKMAALTATRAMVTDGSGFSTASAVTGAELGHLSGVTSALQTQLDAKLDDFTSTSDNRLVRTDGTAGEAVQESGVSLSDADAMTGLAGLQFTTGVNVVQTLDEDTMSSNSATALATQQSIKAYVDSANFSVNSISTNTNAVVNNTYLVDTTGGVVQVTLPTPAANVFVRIKDSGGDANGNNITIARNGSEDIDGVAASLIMDSNFESKTFVSDGTDWWIL